MRFRTVLWLQREQDQPRIIQVYRAGLEYALVSDDGRQCCPFVWCKDFLQDAIQGFLYGARKEKYGFVYDPAVHPPVSLKKTRLVLANSRDAEFGARIAPCLDFIRQIESRLKMSRTAAYRVAYPPREYMAGGVWMVEGSRRWLSAPPMISLYTLLLRVGFAHRAGDDYERTLCRSPLYQEKDHEQIEEARPAIDLILRLGDRRIFHRDVRKNYPADVEIGDMHNRMGICSFAQKKTQQYVPHWHRYYS